MPITSIGVLAAAIIRHFSGPNPELATILALGKPASFSTRRRVHNAAADTPVNQASPRPLKTGVLSLIAGLAVGIAAAFVFDYLDDSIKFMHVSAPIRVMERAEWSPIGLREFGLDPPGYTATLYRRGTAVLFAEFGAPNPQKVLQYMKLGGSDQVFLMSRFIGEEWEKALREASGG